MKKNKRIFILIIIGIISVLMSVTAYAEGEVTGSLNVGENPDTELVQASSFGVNPPEATVAIKNLSGESVTALTPTEAYDIEISVSDSDTIDDIADVNVKLFYDADGTSDALDDFDHVSAADATVGFTIDWSSDNLSTYSHSGQDNTWDVTRSTLPTSSDTTNTSFLYIFRVKIAKSAIETKDGAKWRLGIKTTDKSGNTVYISCLCDMNWYGEIIVPDNQVVVWQHVFCNQAFNNQYAKTQVFTNDASVKYICNGAYSEKTRSDAVWVNQLTNNPTCVSRNTDSAVDNSFAVAIDTTDSYNSDTAHVLPASANDYATIRTNNTGTTDVGVNRYDYYMYIKTSSVFPNEGKYEGSIYFNISND